MFQTGQKIGPYVLDRALGEGSYAVVWLAEERTGLIQRQVAVKLPKDADPDIDVIRHEAATWLHAGKHPNIVQVLHADIFDGQVAIATEYVSGGSLHDWLHRQEGKVASIDQAVLMTNGILAGLQHLHSLPPKPLVHRDLKPGNVLLKGDTPLLTDFGLTRVFSSAAFTQAGGTPAYMPPEAFDERFSPQTDIWASGVTLYRMLKGDLPFPQREFSALIGAIMNKEPEPLPDSVPSGIGFVIYKALMKDPDRRFESAAEMRTALNEAHLSRRSSVRFPMTSTKPMTGVLNRYSRTGYDLPIAMPVGVGPPGVPRVPALAKTELPASVRSEDLTAIPEPRTLPQSLSQRADGYLRAWSRDTATFCATLLASIPAWGVFTGIGRILEHFRIGESLPATMLAAAGLMSVVFARLAWHRFYWMPAQKRRQAAIRYAVLGAFSGTMIPVIAVAFIVAVSGAASAPPDTPSPEVANREIEPPSR